MARDLAHIRVMDYILFVTLNVDITADKLSNILAAANISVDAYWPEIYARSLKNVDKATISQLFGGSIQSSSAQPSNTGNFKMIN